MVKETLKKPVDSATGGTSTMSKAPTEENTQETRRNWIKAGIIGVPVILTLKSKPAWANASVSTSGGSVLVAGGTQFNDDI